MRRGRFVLVTRDKGERGRGGGGEEGNGRVRVYLRERYESPRCPFASLSEVIKGALLYAGTRSCISRYIYICIYVYIYGVYIVLDVRAYRLTLNIPGIYLLVIFANISRKHARGKIFFSRESYMCALLHHFRVYSRYLDGEGRCSVENRLHAGNCLFSGDNCQQLPRTFHAPPPPSTLPLSALCRPSPPASRTSLHPNEHENPKISEILMHRPFHRPIHLHTKVI